MKQNIDGNKVAAKIKKELALEIANLNAMYAKAPGLAVVLVGDNPASSIYVKHKKLACRELGIQSFSFDLENSISEEELLHLIEKLNMDDAIDGILVQLPLPKHINSKKIFAAVAKEKDVDGFHPYNIGKLAQRDPSFRCCTPFGVIKLLESVVGDLSSLSGKKATIVGDSNIVGRPMALELLNLGCTVTICHRKTENLAQELVQADLVVVAIGKANYIKAEWLKSGSIVIDIGINRQENDTITGDVDYINAIKKVAYITPVPGGVGPMTVAMLMYNTVKAFKHRINHK